MPIREFDAQLSALEQKVKKRHPAMQEEMHQFKLKAGLLLERAKMRYAQLAARQIVETKRSQLAEREKEELSLFRGFDKRMTELAARVRNFRK